MRPQLYSTKNNTWTDIVKAYSEEYTEAQRLELGLRGCFVGSLDCLSCIVTEERNGEYDLELSVAIDNPYINDIVPGNLLYVAVKPLEAANSAGDRWQFFKIYQIQRGFSQITAYAHHISYELRFKFVNTKWDAVTGGLPMALWYIWNNTTMANEFSYLKTGDQERSENFKFVGCQSIRKYLGGMEGSIVDCFGGEYCWNNLQVRWYESRGSDKGAVIYHGRNMREFDYQESDENRYEGLVGFVLFEDGTYVSATYPTTELSLPNSRFKTIDYTEDYLESYESSGIAPTPSALQSRLQTYYNTYRANRTTNNRSINAQYYLDPETYTGTEYISLCDTVTVVFPEYKTKEKMKVVKVVYDVLAERNLEIQLNSHRQTLADTIAASL